MDKFKKTPAETDQPVSFIMHYELCIMNYAL
jgi:hypothetical protein